MTPRSVEILRAADIIAAEDTETSMVLLEKFNIKTKLVSNHKFNEGGAGRLDYFTGELQNGKNIALISDAGTPCISDPGGALVRKAAENNIEIISVPGACAAAAAVSVSGFEIKSFMFAGFFPREKSDAKKIIDKLESNPGVYIFYESPKRIIKTFGKFAEYLPECSICLCNDLTKKFERVYRGSPAKILEELRANPSAGKGEYTVVIEIGGAEAGSSAEAGSFCPPSTGGVFPPAKNHGLNHGRENPAPAATEIISPEALIVDIMLRQKCGVKDAVRYIASEEKYNLSKNEAYAASLNLKNMLKILS
jgi:16S rRNA (cytidine1402-2'-O)-methyltransferase